MSPSPGSARNRSISSARPPEARRALPWTADSVVENTTFGSGFQIAAHSSIESSSDGSWSAVSQYSIVSYLVGDEAKDLLVGRRPVEVAVRPDDVAVK